VKVWQARSDLVEEGWPGSHAVAGSERIQQQVVERKPTESLLMPEDEVNEGGSAHTAAGQGQFIEVRIQHFPEDVVRDHTIFLDRLQNAVRALSLAW